jgi:high-affinity nickel-transport protein
VTHPVAVRTSGWTAAERRRIALVLAAVAGMHLLGWGLYLGHQSSFAAAGGLAAVGGAAYLLGLRHGFDADHVAVIDDATRLMLQRGRRPVSTGLWFALGHASVVVALALGIALVAGPAAQQWAAEVGVSTGMIAGIVVVTVLTVLGALNAVVLRDLVVLLRTARAGSVDESEVEAVLGRRGLLARLLRGRLRRVVRRSWHLFGVGFLFGLGMQTATEVTVLALVSPAGGELPALAVLSLPLLFAAGMCTVDSVDGMLMTRAYTWALLRPVRRLWVNIVTTTLTVGLALVVAVVVAAGLLRDAGLARLEPLAAIGEHFELIGWSTLLVFIAVWACGALWWQASAGQRAA